MDTFKFQWKCGIFWKKRMINGFGYDKETDRMTIHFPDGGMYEIAQWSKRDCILGSDFFKFNHAKMEQNAGQTIPVKIAKD